MARRRSTDKTDHDIDDPAEITTQSYRRWRRRFLGMTTQRLEQRIILELAAPKARMRVLDMGCGDGALSRKVHRYGAQCFGLDRNLKMITQARRKGGGLFLVGDGAHLPFADDSFDLVLAVTVLCIAPGRDALIGEMARVLRPGGHLVIGELGLWSLWAMVRWWRGIFGNRVWRNAHFFTPGELNRRLRRAGLAVKTTRGAIYYPPTDLAARLCVRAEPYLSPVLGTFGAAFIALKAQKPLATPPLRQTKAPSPALLAGRPTT